MKKNSFLTLIVILLALPFVFPSCINEEHYATDKSINLQFSADTLTFDTIFTTIGSVTKSVKIYNPASDPIKIDYITLGGGRNSFFRFNADGDTSLVARDLEIGGKDSLTVFVRVELNPNNQSNPLLIEDSLICSFNGKTQSLLLTAYGQDAYYHIPEKGKIYSLAHQGSEAEGTEINGYNVYWKNDKPHVIVGVCAVDSLYTLEIPDNTKIYMGNNASLWVYRDASLKVTGSYSRPVEFKSLRSQGRYDNIPGQWNQIWLMAGSYNNIIDNAVIKNATVGLRVDTCVANYNTLELSNTVIENISRVGILASGAVIEARNVIVQNTGSYSVVLALDGKYRFIGSTIANYWSYDHNNNNSALLLSDWYQSADGAVIHRPIRNAEFYNTIIYGSFFDESIEFDLLNDYSSQWKFDHCLIKSSLYNTSSGNFISCVFNKDPMFEDVSANDLHLMNSSAAIGMGNSIWNDIVPFDIYNNQRLNPPAIGAVEKSTQNQSRR